MLYNWWQKKIQEKFEECFAILINLEMLFKLCHASEFDVSNIESTTRVSELLNLERHNFKTDSLLLQSQINSSKKMN